MFSVDMQGYWELWTSGRLALVYQVKHTKGTFSNTCL